MDPEACNFIIEKSKDDKPSDKQVSTSESTVSDDSGFLDAEHSSSVPRRSVRIVENESKREYEYQQKTITSESPDLSEPSQKRTKIVTCQEEHESISVEMKIQELHKGAFRMILDPLLIFPAELEVYPKCLRCNSSQADGQTMAMNLCSKCVTQEVLKCFICKKANPSHRCNPNLLCFHLYHENCASLWPQLGPVDCPQHKCHTCFFKNCHRQGVLMKCVECPVAYHPNIFCIPAGTKLITKTQIICPRHQKPNLRLKPLNINWCILCGDYGSLICCDYCCYSYHADCINYEQTDKGFKCDFCWYGLITLYMTVVWAKSGAYRWWPALVLPDIFVPSSELVLKKHDSEFCVRFFGRLDYFWTRSNRVFPYTGSNIDIIGNETALNDAYLVALDEALKLHRYLNMFQLLTANTVQKPYVKITTSFPVAPVEIKSIQYEVDACICTKDDPCGPESGCLNRSTSFECDDTSCHMGDSCQNQGIRRRQDAKIKTFSTLYGFGLNAMEDLTAGSFVIEYVGEVINDAEFHRRLTKMMSSHEKNFYFLALSPDLFIDGLNFGNLSRFINHSCDPNCAIQVMFVNGFKRVGIYANCDIKAVSQNVLKNTTHFMKLISGISVDV